MDSPNDALSHNAHAHHAQHHPSPAGGIPNARAPSLNWIAFGATLHCLSGCAAGEVLGMVLGTALGLGDGATIALAVALAFAFGYAFTMLPLVRHGIPLQQALRVALVADTVSIAIMEIVDNLVMLVIPGAMQAGLDTPLFWGSLALALALAGAAAFPVNRWLIMRGRGHAAGPAFHQH